MRDDEQASNPRSGDVPVPIHPHPDGDTKFPSANRNRAERRARATGARFTRVLADRVREILAREQILHAIAERLEATASETVHHVLHSRFSPALHDVLRDSRRDAGAATAASLLNDDLSDAIEHEVVAALRERIVDVLREHLDTALGVAIARSGDDVELDGGAELALQLRRAAELGIGERLRNGLHGVIRDRVREAARDRIGETMRFATGEPPTESEAANDRFTTATVGIVEAAVHDCIVSGLSDRIHVIVTNGVYEAVGARLDEGIRPSWRVAHSGAADDRRDWAHALNAADRRLGGESFAEHVRPYIAAAVRDDLTSALRERLDIVARQAVEETLRDRLAAAIRSAVADQRRWEGIDLRRFGDAIRRQIADALRSRLNEALRAEAMDVLRNRLDAAVQLGVVRGAGKAPDIP